MAYQLQQLRAVMDRRPEWRERLDTQVLAIELNLEVHPEQCVAEARTLLEAVASTLCEDLGLPDADGHDLPQQMRSILRALDLQLEGHPHAKAIEDGLAKLVGSLNGAVSAISQLSTIKGLRHGTNLDLPTLDQRHAAMLGGFCDTFIAFVIEAGIREEFPANESERFFQDSPGFNEWLDETHEPVEILGGIYRPSEVLYTLDRPQYDSALAAWEPEA